LLPDKENLGKILLYKHHFNVHVPGGHYHPAMLYSYLSFLTGFTRGRNCPTTSKCYSLLQRDGVHLVKTEFLDQYIGPAEILIHPVTEKPSARAHRSPTCEEYGKQLSSLYIIHLSKEARLAICKMLPFKDGLHTLGFPFF